MTKWKWLTRYRKWDEQMQFPILHCMFKHSGTEYQQNQSSGRVSAPPTSWSPFVSLDRVFDGLFSSQHTADTSVQIRWPTLETHATSHATHSSHASHSSWHLLLLLGDLCNHGLSGGEQWCHSCSIQQCSPYHLKTKEYIYSQLYIKQQTENWSVLNSFIGEGKKNTLVGSMIPFSTILTYSPFIAS